MVCCGKARPELLDTHEVERLTVIKKILFGTDAATRAVTVRRAAGQRLVYGIARLLLGFRPVRDYLARNITESEINYRGRGYVSATFGGSARPLPGDHAPPAPHLEPVPEGRPVRLYELIRHPAHTYSAQPASVYLIRPDGYLGFRADWPDRHALLEFLETYLIRR
jgi:hypothetical protein